MVICEFIKENSKMKKWRHPFHGWLPLMCCASHCSGNGQMFKMFNNNHIMSLKWSYVNSLKNIKRWQINDINFRASLPSCAVLHMAKMFKMFKMFNNNHMMSLKWSYVNSSKMTKWRHPFHGQLALLCCAPHCYESRQYVQKVTLSYLVKHLHLKCLLKMVICVVCQWWSNWKPYFLKSQLYSGPIVSVVR
jgi:hypothetical protein